MGRRRAGPRCRRKLKTSSCLGYAVMAASSSQQVLLPGAVMAETVLLTLFDSFCSKHILVVQSTTHQAMGLSRISLGIFLYEGEKSLCKCSIWMHCIHLSSGQSPPQGSSWERVLEVLLSKWISYIKSSSQYQTVGI